MSFSTKTWNIGDVLTAADMNQYVRDNALFLFASASMGAGLSDPATVTSAAFLHMGFGSTWKLTPNRTGGILILICAQQAGTPTTQVSLRFGTGTAPVNGAAATGTGATATNVVAGMFSQGVLIGGLTLGTAYWFDVIIQGDGVNPVRTVNNTVTAAEI